METPLKGAEEIGAVMASIQGFAMGDSDKMEQLFREAGIDPEPFAEAAGVMVAVAVAMRQEPEDAVRAAFMTAGLIGAMLVQTGDTPRPEGRDQF